MTLQMILVIVEILTGETKTETDIALTIETIGQMTKDLMIRVTEARVNTIEIEAAVTTEMAGGTVITEAVIIEEVTEVKEETAPPEIGMLVMAEEIETLGATEETVNQEEGTLVTATADPGTDSREIVQGQGIEAKTVTRTPQGMTQDQEETANPRDHMTDLDPHTNQETDKETTLITGVLEGMDRIEEIGHTAETEEIVPEDTTNLATGTTLQGNLLDTLVEDETDLEEETNLPLEMTGTAAALGMTGTAAALEMAGTTAALETGPDLEEEETGEEATAETPSRTSNLIL